MTHHGCVALARAALDVASAPRGGRRHAKQSHRSAFNSASVRHIPVEFQLPQDMRHFIATIGFDDKAAVAGNVVLTILGDGKRLYSKEIVGSDSVCEFDLDIEDMRRLTIIVDHGGNSDYGDQLNLCNARLTK